MVPFIDSLLSEIFATDIKGLKQKKKYLSLRNT